MSEKWTRRRARKRLARAEQKVIKGGLCTHYEDLRAEVGYLLARQIRRATDVTRDDFTLRA